MPRVYIKTFGCQMNEYDSGKMRAQLAPAGFVPTDDVDDADLVIVNTCSIRDKPEQKLHSFLGRILPQKKVRPLTVAVAGCVAQMDGGKIFKKYPTLDLVFGPDAVGRVREMVETARTRRVLDTEFFGTDGYPFSSDLDPDATGKVGSFVTIAKGCDNRCTFCIVPTTRGDEASRPADQILAEVEGLVGQGVREITLIGQNVNSYGLKVPGMPTFAQLLREVHAIAGVEVIRYTTSHPRDMGDDVVACYADLPKLASHLHLPVQSGSDRVLRRMKRFYTRARYLEVIEKLRAARPEMNFTTDFIIGFPGEQDVDFEDTMTLMDAVRFEGSFSFKFSPRPGTPALRLMDEAVPDGVAQARLQRLQDRQRDLQIEAHAALVDQTLRVLVEGPSAHDEGVVCGRTSTFKMVNFPGDPALSGQWVDVKVTRAFANTLRGEVVGGELVAP
ncbi:MAG: tRNA (N6-isopentenyl adenosine(37)-C2)-methylthiotransferase MiaB [Pseudomonadota bacterium]|nr:tRNA (N6-isopentenyl adenosine(37)-C2)-methylthiotransferase MiaB [Pseudomonadota bacterium]